MKIIKYAPVACAIAWTACLILAVFNPYNSYNYRPYFIAACAVLAITYLLWYFKENENAGKTKRTKDEFGRESEHNIIN